MKKNQTLWYTRHQGTIKGPFANSVVINNITLGRLSMHDEISHDQVNWQMIMNVPHVHPDLTTKTIETTKRNLDERNGFDRRYPNKTEVVTENKQRKKDRRASENTDDIQRRQLHTLLMEKFRHRKQHLIWPFIITFSLLASITLLAILFPKQLPVPLANCAIQAGPDINWNNCLKPKLDLHDKNLSNAQLRNSQLVGSNFMNTTLTGADIAYADLRFTNLSYSQLQNTILLGANLKKADLSYADLTNSDLSYADLSQANLGGALLKNTRFDHAIWLNGRLCAPNSIDECLE